MVVVVGGTVVVVVVLVVVDVVVDDVVVVVVSASFESLTTGLSLTSPGDTGVIGAVRATERVTNAGPYAAVPPLANGAPSSLPGTGKPPIRRTRETCCGHSLPATG